MTGCFRTRDRIGDNLSSGGESRPRRDGGMRMAFLEQQLLSGSSSDEASWPILICLLGSFLLLQAGRPVGIRSGGKIETILCRLGLESGYRVPRAALVNLLWPASDSTQATQSLNSLIYSIHKLIGDALGGAPAVLHEDGHYRLNVEAGVGVDIACFDAWANAG